MHTLLLAPTVHGAGLTSVTLGLIRALESAGLKVGFLKPIAQPQQGDAEGVERASALVERTLNIASPAPLSLQQAERALADNELDLLLEEVVSMHQKAAEGKDVVIVEGMAPTLESDYASAMNGQLAKCLDAEVILVATQNGDSIQQMAERIEIIAQKFGGCRDAKVLGVVLNKIKDDAGMPAFVERLQGHLPLLGKSLEILGTVPYSEELNTLRTSDVAALLNAQVISAGDSQNRRVNKIILCARTVPNMVHLLQKDVLVVTPGDRVDIVLASALAELNGTPLAGLLVTGDLGPDESVMDLCQSAMDAGLPVMSVTEGSFDTASRLATLNKETPADDVERATRITDYIASQLVVDSLKTRCAMDRELRLTPAAFRYQLVKRAQDANKRIVLPEGDEPRTIRAAAICQERGIARCVLLAKPEAVQAVAAEQGITLPESLEIIDPASIIENYVAPMCELRKAKGLTPDQARAQLADTVVLGTMMLALDEVDGLVSGAVNTTANTIRPALQLIKTAPGYNLVSSVFFMLLPDQVLVYGDCAVNPNPSAKELAEIALQSSESAVALGVPPRVAMISYSTGTSGAGAEVEKVAEATRIAQELRPDLAIDGPLQYDAASVESVGKKKAPDSKVAGQATVFVFPDLNTGNTTYKAVQRSASVISVGPMLQGLAKPVNDLSRGALVDDIVFTIALTALQAAARD